MKAASKVKQQQRFPLLIPAEERSPVTSGDLEDRKKATGKILAALYARVSTKDKDQDPEMQLKELRNYCSLRGWEIAHEYVDVGFSGSSADRPQFDEMMGDATSWKHKFDVILVWKLDRFGRSVLNLVFCLQNLHQAGVGFISVRDNLDFTTAVGRLMFHVIAAMAEFERDLTIERVRAGIDNARAKGTKFGRPSVVASATVVASLRAQGLSWRKIGAQLEISEATARRLYKRQ